MNPRPISSQSCHDHDQPHPSSDRFTSLGVDSPSELDADAVVSFDGVYGSGPEVDLMLVGPPVDHIGEGSVLGSVEGVDGVVDAVVADGFAVGPVTPGVERVDHLADGVAGVGVAVPAFESIVKTNIAFGLPDGVAEGVTMVVRSGSGAVDLVEVRFDALYLFVGVVVPGTGGAPSEDA